MRSLTLTRAATDALLDPEAREFYCHTLSVFEQAHLEVLVGGAYAFARYTGIERHTKDLDVFVHERDFERTLRALRTAGYHTEIPFPHWLGKAHHRGYYVDVIYGAGNGIARVDDDWFAHAPLDHVFDVPVRLCPPEEMIWSKAFIQERERFDGADVAHLLRACSDRIDWPRLMDRFGANWPVLFGHLVFFGYIYPSDRDRIPDWVMRECARRLVSGLDAPVADERVCRGTVLSRQQYLVDVHDWGYADPRARPDNPMSSVDIAIWTAGIVDDGSTDT